jgi:hypothetical protein
MMINGKTAEVLVHGSVFSNNTTCCHIIKSFPRELNIEVSKSKVKEKVKREKIQ